jgi:hypothetical protein
VTLHNKSVVNKCWILIKVVGLLCYGHVQLHGQKVTAVTLKESNPFVATFLDITRVIMETDDYPSKNYPLGLAHS